MEEQKINKKITFSIVAILLIVLVTIGATYAYFSAQAQTAVQTVTTGTLTMNFDKEGSVVTINGITPINDSEIKTKAAAFPFSITNTGSEHMNITIKLKDITIADDLKDIDFRWGLYNADTDKGISFGIFKYSNNGGEEILYRDSIIDAGSPKKNYVLRIWIHDDGAEQNYMQGETFSGKIEVTGRAVKYTPESCFSFSNGQITDYNQTECGTDVVIPKTIGGVAVTSILDGPWIAKGLTSIIFPDTVTTLPTGLDRNNFSHLTIPEGVTSAGCYPCYFLKSITIPETVTTLDIGETELEKVVIPGSVTNVSGWGNAATDVVLMEGIENLGTMAGRFASIEIPSSVTTVSSNAFLGATNLTEIVVRGKTEIPSGFGTDWNCNNYDYTYKECKGHLEPDMRN